MPERDLKLNSLSRYSKRSPRLVLEEHSHCEVPAGCGGVVLRWRNPDTSLPCVIRVLGRGNYEREDLTLDGKPLTFMKPHVTYGEHVIGLKLRDIDPTHGILMFAGTYDEKYLEVVRLKGSDRVLSAADETWKYTTTQPADETWREIGFDDSGWAVMIEKAMERENKQYSSINYSIQEQEKLGAIPLGIREKATTVWIRKVFRVEREDG